MPLSLYYIADMARKFPIGIQTFAKLREENAIYVDKTGLIYKLAHDGSVYFLSRPRRFGKSLLIDTIAEYFSGNRELFTGLAIDKLESEWKKHPVLRFDFSNTKFEKLEDLKELIDLQLEEYEAAFEVSAFTPSGKKRKNSLRLSNIILAAQKKTGQKVVFLVYEYDAPQLDTLVNKKTFEQMRQTLRDFYSPLKANDAHIKFIFISGITKFSQLSIFSELNNLSIISMMDEYASICGITEQEMRTQMRPEIEEFAQSIGVTFDQACAALKQKYDGYHFSEKSPDIYNPFSLLKALNEKKLKDYWFETGTPTFLVEQIKKFNLLPESFANGFDAIENMFNVPAENATDPLPVLFQSGYLTIKGYDVRDNIYTLGFPNDEVAYGFSNCLMPYYAMPTATQNDTFLMRLIRAIKAHDIDTAMVLMQSFFSSIPYTTEHQDEDHYKTIFYLIFRLLTNFNVRTEECSAAGRADAIVETDDAVYVFEFKLDGSADEALKQIDDKGYLIPYSATLAKDGSPKKLVKIGASFDKEKRTLGEWKIAES